MDHDLPGAPPQFGTITLTGLRAPGRHGVLPEERSAGQPFVVDLDLETQMPGSDDLAGAVDYADLAGRVVAVLQGESVNLIETLAQRIAELVLTDRRVRRVEVRVHKPAAPIAVDFADVSVTISRSNRE